MTKLEELVRARVIAGKAYHKLRLVYQEYLGLLGVTKRAIDPNHMKSSDLMESSKAIIKVAGVNMGQAFKDYYKEARGAATNDETQQ